MLELLSARGPGELRRRLREAALEAAAEELTLAAVNGQAVDWAALDPLGVASVVEAFYFPLFSEM